MRALLRRIPHGVAPILLATAVAGGAGYVVNALVPMAVVPAAYAHFSVLWSMLYLVVAVLGGIQQEVARAAGPAGQRSHGVGPAARLAGGGVVVVAAIVLVVGAPLIRAALGATAVPATLPVALAAGAYVIVAVLSGLLSGLGRWRLVALLIGADGVLRLLAVGVLLLFSVDVPALMWAVAAPFALVALLLWPALRGALSGRVGVDVGLPVLTWNVARAVAGAAAGGLLVSGYPLLLAVLANIDEERLAAVNLAVNLVRAPLVVVVLALQSYLVVRFRAAGPRAPALAARILGVLTVLTMVAAVVAAPVGPAVLRMFGPAYDLPGWFLGGLVAGSGALGWLCVSGMLVLAAGRHGRYLAGWATAAVVAVLALLAPWNLEVRVVASLVCGPAVGVLCHMIGDRPERHGHPDPVGSLPDLPPTRETT